MEGPEGCGEGLALLLKCSGRSQWPVFRKAQSHLECIVPVLLGREWTRGGQKRKKHWVVGPDERTVAPTRVGMERDTSGVEVGEHQ